MLETPSAGAIWPGSMCIKSAKLYVRPCRGSGAAEGTAVGDGQSRMC